MPVGAETNIAGVTYGVPPGIGHHPRTLVAMNPQMRCPFTGCMWAIRRPSGEISDVEATSWGQQIADHMRCHAPTPVWIDVGEEPLNVAA